MPKKVITYEKTARQRKQERLEAEQKAMKEVAPVVEEVVELDAEAQEAAQQARAAKLNQNRRVIAIVMAAVAVVMVVLGSLLLANSVYPTNNPYVTIELVYGEKTYEIEYELSTEAYESKSDVDKMQKLIDSFVSFANAGVYDDSVFHRYESGCMVGGKFIKYELPTTPTASASFTRIVSSTRKSEHYYNVSGISPKQILTSSKHSDDAYQIFFCSGTNSTTDFNTTSTAYYTAFALVLDASPEANRSAPYGAPAGRATKESRAVIDSLKKAIAYDYGTDYTAFASVKLKTVKVKGNLFTKWKNYDYKTEHPKSDYADLT